MNLSIIIPAYNEEQNLPLLLKELIPILKQTKKETEIIIIDDGSTDHTFNVIKKLKNKYPNIIGIKLRKNSGKSSAFQVGFAKAKGKILITMDADLQDDPHDIPKLLNKINQGWDVVSGWRTNRNDTFSRKISTKLFNAIVIQTTGTKLHDLNCGLKAYKKEVIETIDLVGGMHRFMPILATWQGFKITETPVSNRPRKYGQAKYGPERALKGILDLTTIIFFNKYAKRPLRLFGTLGIISFITGFTFGIRLTYLRILGEKIGDRPLLILAVLLIVLGVQFFSLGLLGEMLAKNKKESIPISEKI